MATKGDGTRLQVLDGWRAVSILLVLASHMLPLGPKSWHLNGCAAAAGMAMFFTLSGFLITDTLFRHPHVPPFLVRRFFRIEPLALVATVVYLAMQGKGPGYYASQLLYLVNYDTAHLTEPTSHFWSLCVEVHFYACAALLVGLFGLRGLRTLPLLALAITAWRVYNGSTEANIKTHLRADEIMAGATLALIWLDKAGSPGRGMALALRSVPLPFWAAACVVCCHPDSGPFQYLRAYSASALVGSTLLSAGRDWRVLKSRPLRYVAEISYALYIVHPLSMYGWLGAGDKAVVYLKRPLCFAITFGLAHVSTFAFERRFTALGKQLSRRWEREHHAPVRVEEPARFAGPLEPTPAP